MLLSVCCAFANVLGVQRVNFFAEFFGNLATVHFGKMRQSLRFADNQLVVLLAVVHRVNLGVFAVRFVVSFRQRNKPGEKRSENFVVALGGIFGENENRNVVIQASYAVFDGGYHASVGESGHCFYSTVEKDRKRRLEGRKNGRPKFFHTALLNEIHVAQVVKTHFVVAHHLMRAPRCVKNGQMQLVD